MILGLAGNLGSGKDTVADILVREHGFVACAFADELKRVAKRLLAYDDHTLWGPSSARNAPDPRGADPAFWDAARAALDREFDSIASLYHDAPEPVSVASVVERMVAEFDVWRARGADLMPRFVLQRLGTEWGRALWPDVWVHAAQTTVEAIVQGHAYSRHDGLGNVLPPERRARGVVITDVRFTNEAIEIRSWGGRVAWVDASKRCPRDARYAHASEPTRDEFRTPSGDLIDHDVDNNGPLDALPARVREIVGAP